MSFDFSGVKTNLEGINKYLESNGVKLSAEESKQLVSIFNEVDKNKNNIIDLNEQQSFKNLVEQKLKTLKGNVSAFFDGIGSKVIGKTTHTEPADATRVDNTVRKATAETMQPAKLSLDTSVNKMKYNREDILNIAIDQAIKRMPELKSIKSASQRIQIAKSKYPKVYSEAVTKANVVADMVIKNCEKYEVADLIPVVVTMLGVETGGYNFNSRVMKNPGSQFKGVMQTNLIAIKSLYNDKKSSDVKFVKELKNKYPTAEKLYAAIQNDVELGLQVGILFFKTKIRCSGGNVARGVKSYCGNQYKYDYELKTPDNVMV